MSKPLIFITNDDGVRAHGLQAAIRIARKFGDVVVVAPEQTQSGMSHAITMYSPLFLRRVQQQEGLTVYALNGTPVDCVKMAFDHLLKDQKVDLVISGINHGANSAISVLYSGTMGAAVEGSFYGSPSIGLSLLDHDDNPDFTAAEEFGTRIVEGVLRGDIPTPMCLNVNVPVGPVESLNGIRVCRQNKGYWREEFFCRRDPRGKEYYWLTGDFCNAEPEATDTDEWALSHGYVSIVPVQVDMTDYSRMAALKAKFHQE
ncbi:MAG: 5'/3'-nucleotidase SurE [Rikenellaceae bacterium]|nr:5'/3'-nucleotidase SurE [Rikenellaceae bacterium]